MRVNLLSLAYAVFTVLGCQVHMASRRLQSGSSTCRYHASVKAEQGGTNKQGGMGRSLEAFASFLLVFRSPAGFCLHSGGKLVSRDRSLLQQCCIPNLRASCRSRPPIASTLANNPSTEIRWFNMDTTVDDMEPREGAMTMPVLPFLYTHVPYRYHEIQIITHMSKRMYNDVIFDGTRRFMACLYDEESDRMAEAGVIMHIVGTRDLSEREREYMVKYVGNHSATGPVKLVRVLNPRAHVRLDTYLRAEVEFIKDSDIEEDTRAAEAELRKMLEEIIDMQIQMDENPRFNNAVQCDFALGRKTSLEGNGLWDTVGLWFDFLFLRLEKMRDDANMEMKEEIRKYAESGKLDREIISGDMWDVDDLPEPLADKIHAIEDWYNVEHETWGSEPFGLQWQPLLQSSSHAERLAIFTQIVGIEHKRLKTQAMLQSMWE